MLNFALTSDESWRAKITQKPFSKYLKDMICKIRQNLNYDDNKSKYSNNPKDISKSAKKCMKHFAPRRQLPKLLLRNFLPKFLRERRYLMNNLTLKISLDEIIKSINFQTKKSIDFQTNNSPGNDDVTTESYKHFSNGLAPAFLNVYDFWGILGTMDVTSRTGIIYVIYKKGDKKDDW